MFKNHAITLANFAVFLGTVSFLQAQEITVSRLQQAKTVWQSKLEKSGYKAIPSTHYPTEEALMFLSAYDFTREAKYAEQSARQLEAAHQQTQLGMVMTPHKTTRDYQARQIYNFYVGYRILGDGKYLKWSDEAAAAMLKIIPRAKHTTAGETHKLFAAGFIDPAAPPKPDQIIYTIDVNQNAEVGLAFGLLYHDPASQFFLDPLAKEIAYEETLASMSIQNMTNGQIPLNEELMDQPDTLYGSYAGCLWVWSQSLWHEPKFDPHIRAAGKWLATKMNLEKDSERWYPKRSSDAIMDSEAGMRIPLYWYSGIDAKSFISGLFARMKPNDSSYPNNWAWYDLIGVPRSYYLGSKTE